MIVLLLNILWLVEPARAARKHVYNEPTMVVQSAGSSEFLRAKYPKIKMAISSARKVAAEESRDGYVPPTARTQLFEKLGLTQALAKYDDLDKDMLVMAVRDADQDEMNRLLKGYPNLKLEQLVRLKSELGATP